MRQQEPFNNEIFEEYRVNQKKVSEAIVLLKNNGYTVTKGKEIIVSKVDNDN